MFMMALPYSSPLLFLATTVVVFLQSPCHASYDPDVAYVTCGGAPYFVNKASRIRLTNQQYLTPTIHCEMKLMPTTGTRLVARFLRYHMKTRYVHEYGTCTEEGILLYSQGQHSFFGENGYCHSGMPNGPFYDLGGHGSFGYFAGDDNFLAPPDVELLVTEVRDKSGNTDCPSGYFDCQLNNYCIDEDLTCNGYDDCGNDRDEIEGCGLTAPVIAGIVVGMIVFFILIVILIVFLIRWHRRRVVYISI